MKNQLHKPLMLFLLLFVTSCSSVTPTLAVDQTNQPATPELTLSIQDLIDEETVAGKARAVPIIEALERYFASTNRYPDELQRLIPDYLAEVPITLTGQEYQYNLFEPHDYVLSFNISRKGEKWFCGYLGKQHAWECGMSAP